MNRETIRCRRSRPVAMMAAAWMAGTLIAAAPAQDNSVVSGQTAAPVALAGYTPKSALAYGSVPSVAALAKELERHPFARLYRNREVQTFLKPAMGMVRGMLSQVQDFTGMSASEIVELVSGRVDFSLVGVKQGEFGTRPVLALSLGVSDLAKASGLVARMVELGRDEGMEIEPCKVAGADAFRAMIPFDVFLATVRGSVVLTTDEALLGRIVKQERLPDAERLAANAVYGLARTKTQADAAHVHVGVNIAGILKVVLDEMDEGTANEVQQAVSAIGADTVDWLADSMRFNEFGVREMLYVHTGKRKGLMKILDAAKPGVTMAKDVPGNAALYWGLRVDPLKAYEALKAGLTALHDVMPDDDFEEMIELFERLESGDLGFKLRDDVLASLSDEMAVSVGLPVGSPIPSFLLRGKLRNPAKIAELLEMAREHAPSDEVTVTKRKISGAIAYVVRKSGGGFPVSPVVAVVGDQLVVAPNVSMVRRVIKDSFSSRLAEQPVFQNAVKRLGQFVGRGSQMVYIDLEKALTYGYEMLSPMVSSFDSDDLPVPIDLAMLPTTEAVTEHFAHVLSTDVIDEDGYLTVTESPIPLTALQLAVVAGMPLAMGGRYDARAMPVEAAPRPTTEAPKTPAAPRPKVGVVIDDLPNGGGVRVAEVRDGSPGAKAGLQVGDVIVGVDGKKISNGDPIETALGKKRIGDQIVFQVKRSNGTEAVIMVRL